MDAKAPTFTVPEPYQDTSDDELLQEPEGQPDPRRRWQTRIEEAYLKDPSYSATASADGLELEGALWYREGKLVMPDAYNLRHELLLERHSSPYSGTWESTRPSEQSLATHWWKTMRQDILHHVRTCHTCQLNKSRSDKPSGLLQPVEVPENSWECVSMDCTTGLPKSVSGLDAILLVVDKGTKMAHSAACKSMCDAKQTANCFCTILCACMGCP